MSAIHSAITAAITAAEQRAQKAEARVAELEAENFTLAAGVCIYPNGNGLLGDEGGSPFCGVEKDRLALDEQVTDLMAWNNELTARAQKSEARVAELEAENAELRRALHLPTRNGMSFVRAIRHAALKQGDPQ